MGVITRDESSQDQRNDDNNNNHRREPRGTQFSGVNLHGLEADTGMLNFSNCEVNVGLQQILL